MTDSDTHSTTPVEKRPTKHRQRGRWIAIGAFVIVACALGAAVGWAARTAFAPAEGPETAIPFSTVAVTKGEVGSSMQLTAAAEWKSRSAASNGATGVITSVDIEPGAEAASGQRLFTVNMRPVVVAQGQIPAFGPTQLGDTGEHVKQLQQFLRDLGYFGGSPDGTFGAGTERAVRAWQKKADFPADGVVQEQDIVWLANLPARLVLPGDTFAVGKRVSAGSGEILVLSSAPEFRIPLTDAQAQLVQQGTTVLLAVPEGDGQWEAIVKDFGTNADAPEITEAVLTAPDGSPDLCAEACNQIAVSGESLVSAEIVTVPAASGLVVPTSAIRTDASGATSVIDEAGEPHAITVVQTARGMSVIEGIAGGTVVRIPVPE